MMSCHGAEEGRSMLLELVQKGSTDQQVEAAFIEKYGKVVVEKPGTQGFDLAAWVMPPLALLAGFGILWMFIKRILRKPTPVTAGDTAVLDRYRDTIEKDMSSLDE